MKYRFLTFVIILISLFSLTVSAAELQFDISTDESFISVNRGDDLTQISSELDMTADELNTYFNRNGIEYFAILRSAKVVACSRQYNRLISWVTHQGERGVKSFDLLRQA